MKICTSAFALFLTISAFAQNPLFESPYTFNGETFTLQIPQGYHHIAEGNSEEPFVYSTNKELTLKEINQFPTSDVILISYEDMGEQMVEQLLTFLIEVMKQMPEGSEQLIKPRIDESGGVYYATSAMNLVTPSGSIPALNISQFRFGDYTIMINCAGVGEDAKTKTPELADKMMHSLAIIQTSKESAWKPEVKEYDNNEEGVVGLEEEIEEENPIDHGYGNSLFATQFSPEDIYFDQLNLSDNWSELTLPDMRLLAGYSDQAKEGEIRIFSGGSVNQYAGYEDAIEAIKQVIEGIDEIAILKTSDIEATIGMMKKHSVDANIPISCFYTIVIKGELFFFIVQEFSNENGQFHREYENFITSFQLINQ